MKANPEAKPGQLSQFFFWGGHGGIGGGDDRQIPCSTITLRYVIDEMKERCPELEFADNFLPDEPDLESADAEFKSTGFLGFLFGFLGRYIRQVNSVNAIHPSAIKRYQLRSDYRPEALSGLSETILDTVVHI